MRSLMTIPALGSAPVRRFAVLSLLLLLSLCLTAPSALATDTSNNGGSVNPFYGSFATEAPIAVPAFHGMEPTLKLSYGSGGGNALAGVGWGISGISYIERSCPGGGAPKYDANDVYFLDGTELMASTRFGGTHVTKIVNYARITYESANNRWVVTGTNGNNAYYTAVYQTSKGTFRWMLTSVVDPHGNTVTYGYWNDGGSEPLNVYLSTVSYNGTTVSFYWELRPDIISYATGANVGQVRYRLKSVEVKTSGSVVRGYGLQYTQSSSTSRSLVTSIQQFGTDATYSGSDLVGSSLPAMTMAWSAPPSTLYGTSKWLHIYDALGRHVCNDVNQFKFSDVNGDARADYITWIDGEGWYVALANSVGTGFNPLQKWLNVYDANGRHVFSTGSSYYRFVDLNGDGKADYVTWDGGWWVALSNGSGFDQPVQWTSSHDAHGHHLCENSGLYYDFRDFNGDGKADYVTWINGVGWHVLLTNESGTGFEPAENWLAVYDADGKHVCQDAAYYRFADFNGDGKTDYVSWDGGWRVSLSTGSGFTQPTQWSSPTNSEGYHICENGGSYYQFADMNGDGKSDYVTWIGGQGWYVALSDGESFGDATKWINIYDSQNRHVCDDGATYYRFTDLNGDGKPDYAYWDNGWLIAINTGTGFATSSKWLDAQDAQGRSITESGSSYFEFADFTGDGKSDYITWMGGDGWYVAASYPIPSDLVYVVGNGMGGSTLITYAYSSQWANQGLPVGMVFPTVMRETTSDGRGTSAAVDYSYEGGRWSWEEKRFLGFRKVTTVLDAQGTYTETYYYQQEGSISKPEYVYYYDNTGALYNYSNYKYTQLSATAPYESLLTEQWSYVYDLTSGYRRTLTAFGYDQYGNVITSAEYGDYDVAGDERTKVRGYYPNASTYLVGLPAYEQTRAGIGTSGTLQEEVQYLYDGSSTYTAAPAKGDATTIRKWKSDDGTYASKSFTYDGYGNKLTETDERGYTTTTEYDTAYNIYPIRKTNALQQSSTKTWDTVLSLALSTTDANGAVSTNTYDAIGRKTKITHPDNSETTIQYLDFGNPASQRIRETTADGIWTETYQDGLGREYKAVHRDGTTVEKEFRETTKQISRESLPYKSGETVQWVQHFYDGLGRERKVTNPDGTFSTVDYFMDASSKPYVVNTDELGNQKTVWKDAYGRITVVREHVDGQTQDTFYEYDVLDHLTRITDALGQTITFTYDSLGRKLNAVLQDGETWSYEYDAAGLLIAQTNPKSETSTFTYDELGRKTLKTGPGGETTRWYYDEPGHGYSVGRLTRVEYPDGAGGESHSYDIRGLETGTTLRVRETAKSFSKTFDTVGRVDTITYPSGETVTYDYDADSGRLASVPGYVDSLVYNTAGQITSATYANGVTSTFEYDAARKWLDSATVAKGGTTLYEAEYDYDASARVTSVASTTHALFNVSYTYDALSRLKTVTGAQEQTLTYNAVGDILTNTGVEGFGEEEPGRTYTWDSDNRLTSVSVRNDPPYKPSVWNFLYDPEGGRIEKSGPDGATMYFGLAEVVDGKLVQYYFAGAMLVAKKDVDEGGAKTFYHADRLGSTRVMTDESGNKVKDYEYAAFGQTLAETGDAANEIGFTGHRTDAGTGLIYMGARYYDAQLGRFISPDTVLPDVYNPQALNRYSYVLNNPVNNTDPSGHAPVAVAAVSYAITMYSAGAVITTVTVTATIGFGLSVAGYCLKNPVLSAIGGIMSGFAGGYSMAGAAGWSDLAQAANGIMGASASFLNSPLSPLDAQTRQIVGWAWTAYGLAVSISNMSGDYIKAAGADQNVSIRDGSYAKFTAPLSNASNSREVLLAQNDTGSMSDAGGGMYPAAEVPIAKADCDYISGGEIFGIGWQSCQIYVKNSKGNWVYIGDTETGASGLTAGPVPMGRTFFTAYFVKTSSGPITIGDFSGASSIQVASFAFSKWGLSAGTTVMGSMRSVGGYGLQEGLDAPSADIFWGYTGVRKP